MKSVLESLKIEKHKTSQEPTIDLRNLADFIFPNSKWGKKPYGEILVNFKKSVFGENAPDLKRGNLKFFVEQILRIYEIFVEFELLLKEPSEKESLFKHLGHLVVFISRMNTQAEGSQALRGEKLTALKGIYEKIIATLKASVQYSPKNWISLDFFEQLGHSLGPFNFPAKVSSIFEFARSFFEEVFSV